MTSIVDLARLLEALPSHQITAVTTADEGGDGPTVTITTSAGKLVAYDCTLYASDAGYYGSDDIQRLLAGRTITDTDGESVDGGSYVVVYLSGDARLYGDNPEVAG